MIVDFAHIPEQQEPIHARLLNWARWCHGAGHAKVSAMFRMYRSTEVWAAPVSISPVDGADAAKMTRGVIALPEDFRHAIQWHYVKQGSPLAACRRIGCTKETLARLVIDGRSMLINRRV